jgi:hypothetical protein
MKTYWFKAKKYGYGWYPATWQGWAVLTLYIVYVVYRANAVDAMFDTETSFAFRLSFELILPTIALITICYFTGEPPKWRWGDKK